MFKVSQAAAASPSRSASGGETDNELRNDGRNEENEIENDQAVQVGREDRGEEGGEQGAGSVPVEEAGVQCPLCGVTYAINVIEVHASGCDGLVEHAGEWCKDLSVNTALLWQKEASDKSEISCKKAKCVCHFH